MPLLTRCISHTWLLGMLQVLDKLLDRTHMVKNQPAPYPDVAAGYEVMQQMDGAGLLAGVNQ